MLRTAARTDAVVETVEDAGVHRALLEALVRIRDESGVAMILVEQKADLTLSFAAEAAVIDRGKIVYRGSSAALRNDAALQAQFLGVGGDERK